MIKSYLYSTILLLFFGNILAQGTQVKTVKSELFKDDYKQTTLVLGEKTNDNQILLVRSYKANSLTLTNGYLIEKHDLNLKLIKDFEYKIDYPNTHKYKTVLGVFYTNKNVNIVEIFFDLKEKAHICQVNIINENFNISTKELFRISKDEMKKYGNFNLQDLFFETNSKAWTNDNLNNFNIETDKKYNLSFFNSNESLRDKRSNIVMIKNENKTSFSIILDYKNQDQKGYMVYLFDKNFNLVFDKHIELKIREKDYVIQNATISNNEQKVYILAKNYNIQNKIEVGRKKYDFEMSEISDQLIKTESVEIENKFIKSLKLNFYKNNIYCLGFYSEKDPYNNEGICFYKFNSENLVAEKITYTPFTDQFKCDKHGKKPNKEIKHLKIKNVHFENDDIFFNAEEEYETSTQHSNNIGGLTTSSVSLTSINFDDIAVIRMNINGQLLWSRNINKSQNYTYSDEAYLSIFSTVKEGNNYFFINASNKEKQLKDNRIEFNDSNPNKANLYLLKVNYLGEFSYQLVLDEDDNKVPFVVSKGISIDKSFYFLGKKGKEKQLLKIDLN
jgi:hypothetical protein